MATAVVSWSVTTFGGAFVWLDPSFVAGVQMAAADRLLVGTEVVSTYGPRGFLAFPQPYVGAHIAVAWLFAGPVHVGLTTTLFARAASVYLLPVALLLALIGGRAISSLGSMEAALVLVFLGCVEILRVAASGRHVPWWIWVVAGAVAGTMPLGKITEPTDRRPHRIHLPIPSTARCAWM